MRAANCAAVPLPVKVQPSMDIESPFEDTMTTMPVDGCAQLRVIVSAVEYG
jgi:hypothetical protein